LADGPHRLAAVGRLADHLDALLLEQVAQARAEEGVVVDEQHARVGARFPLRCSLLHLCHAAPTAGESSCRYPTVIVTVRRPQPCACATDGNQRSTLAPWTPPPMSAATASP